MGETSTTAYAGNKGKANAEAIEALQTSVVHKTDAETISGYKTFSSGLNSSSNIQIDNNDGEYLSISGSTLFRGNGSGPDSYIDIPRNKGTSSAHATLAITDDIPDVSGKANDSDVVHKTGEESVSGIKHFSGTSYRHASGTGSSGTTVMQLDYDSLKGYGANGGGYVKLA